MINKIWYKGKLLIDIVIDSENRKCKKCIFEDGSSCKKSELTNNKIDIECNICNKLTKIRLYHNRINKLYICKSCYTKNNNPFKGKHHTEAFKQKLSTDRKGKRLNPHSKSIYQYWAETYDSEEINRKVIEWKIKLSIASSGYNNPFFGKTHSIDTIQHIVEKGKLTRSQWGDDKKIEVSQNQSNAQHKLKEKDPEKYKQNKSKAAKASINSRERYAKTNPEILMEQELKRRNLIYKYSIIFCNRQFDFGVGPKEYKILLEVQGDYWHGNPRKFNKLNNIQKRNIEKDKLKLDLANKYNFKLFYIWEEEINKKDFSMIDRIEDLINEIRVGCN